MTMAHASHATYATTEEIVDGNLLADPELAPGTIPGLYVNAIAEAKSGAWPLGVPHGYEPDRDHCALYAQMAASAEGFETYLADWVSKRDAAE